MQCKRCMVVMEIGTSYEQKQGYDKPSHKRFCECKKCHDRVYVSSFNFQEVLARESEKSRNK